MTALEPELGPVAPATPTPAPVIAPEPVDLASLFTPSLPSALEQRISSNLAGEAPTASPVTNPTPTTPIPAGPASTEGLDTDAIITNLPDMKAAFVRKYTRLGPSLMKVPEPVRRSLVDLDLQRINKGQPPLNDKDSLAAILAATKQEAITKPAKDESILGRIANIPESMIGDMAAILKGIPHMPIAIWNEVVHNIPNWSEHYQENVKAGMNPVAAFLNSPGVRFIPGSFVAGSLAQGGDGAAALLDHPVMAALDVLLYANAAAKLTEVGALATMADRSPVIARLTSKVASVDDPAAALLRDPAVNAAGNVLVPNRLAAATKSLANKSTMGRWLDQAFSKDARDLSIINTTFDERLATGLAGKGPVKGDILGDIPLEQAIRDAYANLLDGSVETFGVDPARALEITDMMRFGEDNRAFLDTLPDNEAAFARNAIAIGDAYAKAMTDNLTLPVIGGEIYDVAGGKVINKAIEKQAKIETKITETVAPRLNQLLADLEAEYATRAPRGAAKVAQTRTRALAEAIDAASNPDLPGTWADAVKVSQGIRQGRTALGSSSKVGDASGPTANIRLDSLEKIHSTLKSAAKAEAKVEKQLLHNPPARFHDLIHHLAQERIKARLIEAGEDPAAVTRAVLEYDYNAFPDLFTEDLLKDTVRDIARTWPELRAAGEDPVFVHRVSAGGERLLRLPRVSAFNQSLSQTKGRVLTDPIIHNGDITVALAHQGAEILAKRVSQEYIDTIIDTFGKSEEVLLPYYMALARKDVANGTALQVRKQAMALMDQDFPVYTPENFRSFPRPSTFDQTGQRVRIPRGIKDNLDRIHNPQVNGLAAVLGPTTGVFRTSVLALSPRWHIYNIFGGAIALMAEHGPGVFLEFTKARRMLKEASLGIEGETVLPAQIHASLGIARRDAAEVADFNHGLKMGQFMRKVQEHKVAQLGSKVVQKSYDLNSWFDDAYRIMSFEYGKKGALRKGAAPLEAEAVGLESMRRTSQYWAELTPIERNSIRQVFPFYAFTSHMMRYVANFPFNHPMRAAIVANITKAELTDQKDGLGQSFFDSIGLGRVGPDGKQLRMSLTGINPFSSVANQFTIAGFLSGINPLIATALEQSGFTSNPGGIYADKVYDPATGKLATAKPGLAASLIGNVLPQSQALVRASGMDAQYNELLRNNPDAAQRLMSSSLGVPNILRRTNMPQQYMRAELARQEAQRLAFRSALSSGDWSEAEKYPALRPLLDQIRTLRDQGALTAYNPRSSGASTGVVGAVQSVGAQLPWPT